MCVACREFLKEKMNVREFKNALREVSLDSVSGVLAAAQEEHLREIEKALRETAEDPELLRKRLSPSSA